MRVSAVFSEFTPQSLLIDDWLSGAVIAGILVVLWLSTPRLVSPLVRRLLRESTDEFEHGEVTSIELAKRSKTIASLTVSVVRLGLGITIAIIIVGILGLWWLLAAVGILLVALTVAGQPIVLDFLMGLTIVVEGTFFEGDSISVGDPKFKIFGTVEKVGLRHTVIRAPDGTVHSISNRYMAESSNRTRVFAGADVTVRGIREPDFSSVVTIMNRVGQEVAEDPRFTGAVIEPLTVKFVDDPDDLGWSAIMRGRVVAGERWNVGTEVRKRVILGLREAGIELNRR